MRSKQFMKWLGLCICCIVLMARHACADEAENACAPVTCSNHGVCVIQKGEPTCACDEGYMPDSTNGLSCQPASVHSPQTPTFSQEQAEIQAALNLKSPPEAAYCLSYKATHPNRHCALFWQDYYNRKKRSSLLFLIPGILGMGAGAVMGIVVDPVAGVGIGAAGIILTSVGAIMLANNARRARRLNPLVMKYSSLRGNDISERCQSYRLRWHGTALSVKF